MRKVWKIILLYLSLFILLPSVLLVTFQKNVSVLLYGDNKPERYLPGILYQLSDREMHMETLKAQAVIVRSNVIHALEEGEVSYDKLKKGCTMAGKNLKGEDRDFYQRLVQVCKETEGEVVLYNRKVCYCPFFYSSNGTTRDAFTFFKNDSYPYVVAVPSHKDEESKSYISYHHFSTEEFTKIMKEISKDTFQNQIEILESDASGYVTWMRIGDVIVGGEFFRHALGLASSAFSIEQQDGGIRITCKGRGHGFGFSQYGANAMAEGKTYKELLEYYFHNIIIENVYSFS